MSDEFRRAHQNGPDRDGEERIQNTAGGAQEGAS